MCAMRHREKSNEYHSESIRYDGGACGVMLIVVGNGLGDMSSNPG